MATKRRKPAVPDEPVAPAPWVLVYSKGIGNRLAWLIVDDVPADVGRAVLAEALEGWRRWSRFTPPPGGRTLLQPVAKLHGEVVGMEDAEHVPYVELAPETRSITVPIPGRMHSRLVFASRRRGQSLQAWAVDALDQVAAVELGEVK